MNCDHVQDYILQSFVEDARSGTVRQAIAAHLLGCAACTAFAARQQRLDERLTATFPPPEMSPAFRLALRAQIRRERWRAWRDSVPDVVHFVSCGLATLWCAVVLPFEGVTVAAAGATAAFMSYAVLTTVRQALEDADVHDA